MNKSYKNESIDTILNDTILHNTFDVATLAKKICQYDPNTEVLVKVSCDYTLNKITKEQEDLYLHVVNVYVTTTLDCKDYIVIEVKEICR